LTLRVTDLEPRVYRYASPDHTLVPLGSVPTLLECEELILQREFLDAAAILFVVGNLANAVALYGSHGHRQLLLRSGMAIHRAWLAGISLGLVGCPFAGIVSRTAETLLQTDPCVLTPLFALAIGSVRQRVA